MKNNVKIILFPLFFFGLLLMSGYNSLAEYPFRIRNFLLRNVLMT